MKFDDSQKQELLEYARRSLINIVKDGKRIEEDCPDSNYLESAGVFVTLYKNKELRGCVGYIEPYTSIWDSILDNTIAAATNDIRFTDVLPEELEDIWLEISILTPPKECKLEEIEVGKNGVVIQQGANKATYLPQVWESMPEKNKFLDSLCLKAGLDNNCWQNKTTVIKKYEAIVFSE